MSLVFQKNATSKSIYLMIRSKASSPVGMGLTGLVFNTAGFKVYYARRTAAAVAISMVTQTVTGAWTSGGFVEVDATNAPGLYRLDLPNAVLATGVDGVVVTWTGSNTIEDGLRIALTDYDPVAAGPTATDIRDSVYTSTQPELTSAPPVNNATFAQQLNWLYHRFRNKRRTQNTSRTVFRADGSTTLAASTLSDDGTNFDETAET